MSKQTFDSRSGCLDYGSSYEFLLAACYGLELSLNETVVDFKISTNNSDLDKFDDVVLEIKYENTEELYALQLKHSSNTGYIALSSFAGDKDFGLKKYYNSFKNTEQICTNNPAYSIPFEKFNFILYTNQKLPSFNIYDKDRKEQVSVDEFWIPKQPTTTVYKHDRCVANGLLNLSGSNDHFIFKFKSQTLGKDFLNQFYLYTKQQSAPEIERRISKLISTLFHNCDDSVITKYMTYFKFWWRGDFGYYKLTKADILLKIIEYVLESHVPESPSNILETSNFQVFNEILNEFDVIVVTNTDLCVQNIIWSLISSTMAGSLNDNQFFKGDLETLINEWKSGLMPLFIDVPETNKTAIYSAIKICESLDIKRKFVLLDDNFNGEKFSPDIKILQNLADIVGFNKIYKRLCKQMKISIQGRELIGFEELLVINEKFPEIITVKQILDMLNGTLLVGLDFRKDLPKHYVTRFVPKILLKESLLDEIDDEIFLIDDFNIEKKKFKAKTISYSDYCILKDSKTFNTTKCIIISSSDKFDNICQLNPKNNCHSLKINKLGFLELIQSKGNISKLRRYQIQNNEQDECICDSSLLDYYKNRINILCAPAGMGKSLMLKFMKTKCRSTHWIVTINFNDHIKFFKENHTFLESLQYFLDLELQSSFDKDFIKLFNEKKNLVFFWDGFDELPSKCIDSMISMIKMFELNGYYQWISARDNSKNYLEETFQVFSLTIKQFSHEDQQTFISNYLRERYSENDTKETLPRIISKITSPVNCGYVDYSGVPLQIVMMLEIILRNPEKYLKEFTVVTLTDIYHEFMEGKFKNFFNRANVKTSNYLMQKITDSFKHNQLPLYEIAALKASFDDETFMSLNLNCDAFLKKIDEDRDALGLIFGLNDENKPIFTHKTYQEFLTASWLAKNGRTYSQMLKVLFREDFENIRLMFDMILAKDSPVHIAVLYHNLPILKQFDNIADLKDKEGRNALQIACSWSKRHFPVNVVNTENDKTIICINELPHDSESGFDVIEFLLSKRCNPFEKDQLLGLDAIEYADESFALASLEMLLQFYAFDISNLKNFNIISLLYYSIKYNYQNIFKKLEDYPYIEILENEESRTLLHFAVHMNRTDFVSSLLTVPHYQKVINKPYKDFGGPLFSAAANGNLPLYNLLQENGAVFSKNQISPIISAVGLGFDNICQKLLEEGMNPNECNIDGHSLLQIAVLKNLL